MRDICSQLKLSLKVYINNRQWPYIRTNCLLCRGATGISQPLCRLCLDTLPRTGMFCPCCGLPETRQDATMPCASCLKRRPVFDLCLSAYRYEYPVNRIIQKIKYSRRIELINPIIQTLAGVLTCHYQQQPPWPEAIIPVPLHYKRLVSRGFNQAGLLASSLARQLPVRLPLSNPLKRQKNTLSQKGLAAKDRRKNIHNAFILKKKARIHHVAVIDDVVTTCETVTEISRVLKKNGVQKVDIWCLARTPPSP